jgi:ribonuclease Z
MKKFLTYLVLVLVVLGGLLRFSLEFDGTQDTTFRQFARVAMTQAARSLPEPESLRAYVCGSASPLGMADQAQACIAVLTPSHFYVVDLGAGALRNISRASLPMSRLQGVFLTHFHSDHIAELYEANLNSWVQGRPEPLVIYGPKGVRQLTRSINDTYEMDRSYRIEHHGADLLAPELGEMVSKTVRAGVVLEDGDLTVIAYIAAHDPAKPALGYRFDYRGRSIVISGDSLVTDETRNIADGTDLLLHDALSTMLVTTTAEAAEQAGNHRVSKIMMDVLDYHASTDSLVALSNDIEVGMVAYYHLVPVPQNLVMQKIFERSMPDNYMMVRDGTWFELPADSSEIIVSH